MAETDETVDQRAYRDETVDQRGGDLTVDQRGGRGRTGRLRTILPDNLLARFEPVQNLNVSAGQADLVLCRDLADEREVVVKLYRNALQLDRDVMEKLYQADPAHVVRLIDHGDTDGEPWEVQEYCPMGTLTDFRVEQGGALSKEQTRQALEELADAVDHIHNLGITHRDLKPENVLVRSTEPLDLVLTDFGVAAEQIVTVQLQTVAASWAWAAPEVHTKGAVSYAIDWWALGAIVYQLLTGRHVLAGPDGRLPGDSKQIRATVVDGLYSTEAITEPRWRNLVDGLLSYNPAKRWAHAEIESWLSGHDPPVERTVPLADLGDVKETHELKYVFNGHPVRSGTELVAAMRQDWQPAGDLLSGRLDPALEEWLKARPDGARAVTAIGFEKSGGARLIRLQAELDRGGPLEYQGVPINDESLATAIQQANSWTPGATGEVNRQHTWLKGLRQERILGAMAAVVEGEAAERLGRADQTLDTWAKQAQAVLDSIPEPAQRELASGKAQAMLGFMFSVALGSLSGDDEVRKAKAIADARDTDNAGWAEELAVQVLAATVTDLGTVIPAAAVIESVTSDNKTRKRQAQAEKESREQREREARERAEAEQRLRVRRERRQRRLSALRGQIAARVTASVIYSVFASIFPASVYRSSGPSAGLMWQYGWPILAACLVTVSMALVVDWFLDNPGGGLRILSTSVGLCIGAAAWVNMSSAWTPPYDYSKLSVMPWAFGISWMIGSVLQYAMDRLRANHTDNDTSRSLTRSRVWRMIPSAIGGLTGLSALFFGNCWGDCAAVSGAAWQMVSNVGFLMWNPPGLAGSYTLVVVLAVASLALTIAAPDMARAKPALGVVTAVAGPLLGILVFFAYEPNLVGLIIAWIAGMAS